MNTPVPRSLSIGFIFLALCTTGYSQVHFRFGVEYGHSFPDESSHYGFSDGNSYYLNQRKINLHSQVIGLTTDVTFLNHITILSGYQYQKKGTVLETYNRRIDGSPSFSYVTNERDLQEFKKLCIPVGLGLMINVWELRIMLMAGFRLNRIVRGKLYHEREIHYTALNTFYNYEDEFDIVSPVKETRLGYDQGFYGISVLFFEHVRLSFTTNRGGSIHGNFYPRSYAWFGSENNDYILSVAYMLKRAPEFKRVFHRTGHKSVRYL